MKNIIRDIIIVTFLVFIPLTTISVVIYGVS